MLGRNKELVEWKLSVAVGLIRYAAGDEETSLNPQELWGICEILNEVRRMIKE